MFKSFRFYKYLKNTLIEHISNENKNFNLNNVIKIHKWTTQINTISKKVKRKVFSTDISGVQLKFLEYIKWNMIKPKCIIIGYNPSMCQEAQVDFTNQNIIYLLKEYGYGGYFLLNIYPEVNGTPSGLTNPITSTKFIRFIIETLSKNEKYIKTLDTILVWGVTHRPLNNKNFIIELNKILKKDKLFCSVTKGTQNINNFAHPLARYKKKEDLSLVKVSSVKNGNKKVMLTPQQ